MSGWIKLHRKMLDWEWYDDANCFRLFTHLLLIANHKPNKWRGITIDRGQRLTSIGKLSTETGLSVSQIRTAMLKLESTGEIASKSQAQHTVFTIKNYDFHQGDDKALASEIANESQTNDKALATNKNDKNENNVIKDLSTDGEPPAKKDKKFNPDDLKLAEWFYEGLLELNPQHKKPNFETSGWADAIRLMREQDKRTYDQIAELYQWVHKDDFWKAQILSPKKLREKWDALWIKKQNPIQGQKDINKIDWATPLVEKIRSGKKRY
jgi:DNA-binding transcriptional regulator YhcF (GntR family)